MIKGVRRWLRRLRLLALALVLAVLALLAPVAYVELACRGGSPAQGYEPLLPPEDRRPESNTLVTYPEWHIVHAYDDYAEVIRRGDPHDYGYLDAIGGFWSSFCTLSRTSAAHGGVDGEYKRMVHVIGVSFTAELLLKAAYEETVGRLSAWIRGSARSPLDELSARQAADYADFLEQTPWYRWDFRADAAEVEAAGTDAFHDRERRVALALEYRAKAAYAGVIAEAVAQTGADELTMRSVVTGLRPKELSRIAGVTVIGPLGPGVAIETPRYRAFTDLARILAAQGVDFVEIAGNDDILVTTLAERPGPADPSVLAVMPRQGNPGVRELRLLHVADLGALLRGGEVAVEHIHDY